MVYDRFVEIGRVALVNDGCCKGKLAVVLDIVDQKRALIDGPSTGVPRQAISFRHLALTSIKVPVPRGARSGTVRAVFDKADALGKFNQTAWAQRLAARAKRASLSDFDRFKLMVARKQRSAIVNTEFNKLKKAAAGAAAPKKGAAKGAKAAPKKK